MDSNENDNATKEGYELTSTELDEEEYNRIKKKSRRVSFADITSVHVFDRDEDLETPPDNKSNDGDSMVSIPSCESPEPYHEGLEDKDVRHRLHLTPTSGLQENKNRHDSPGSLSDKGTPSEDGEFFGPVSLWHIAPGMGACSPVADDITLDCTTFSLQFGKLMVPDKQNGNTTEGSNIAPLDTERRTLLTEDFKTPAGQTERASIGNSMVLTEIKKQCARLIDPEDKTFESHEGMNNMSLIEENQFNFDFASLPPDLDSLLAEKLLQVQENPGASFHQLESATAPRKICHGTELKASANTEMRMSTTETRSTIEQDNMKMKLDQERNQIMTENTEETQQQQHKHVGPFESILEFVPSKASDDTKVISITDIVEHNKCSRLTTEKIMKGQNKDNVEQVMPYVSHDAGLKDPSDVAVETVNLETMSAINNATGFTTVIETSQPKVEIMATSGKKDDKLRQSNEFHVPKLEGQQQEEKQNRLLEMGSNMELGDDACNNYERSARNVFATKHNITPEATQDVEVNNPMDELEAKECSKDNTLESAEVFAHSNFYGNQCYLKQQRNYYEVTPIKRNASTPEILANKCDEGSKLKITDDSSLSKSHRKQQKHHNQKIDEYDPTEYVGTNMISNNIVANNCKENNKLESAYAFSLSNFDGKQQQYQMQRKLLPHSGSETALKVISDTEGKTSSIGSITDSANLIRDKVTYQSIPDSVSTTHAMPIFSCTGSEQQQQMLLNVDGYAENKGKGVKPESDANYIMEFNEKNAMMATLDVEVNQSACKTAVTNSTKGTNLTMVDAFLPCKFDGRHHQEKQQKMLNSAQDTEMKISFSLESETCTLKVMATRENNDMQLRPGVQLNQSLEIMPITCNDYQLRSPDGSVSMHCSGINKINQQPISLSEQEMESKNPVSVDTDGSNLQISENQHTDETKLTRELETSQFNIGIVKAKDNKDGKFARDVERNQSFDGSDKNRDAFTPSTCISEFNCTEECQVQQKQIFSFGEGFSNHGNSKLLENQLVSNLKEPGTMSETVKMKVTTTGKEHKQEISCSAPHVSSIGEQISPENGRPLRSVELFPESNEAAERNGKLHGKHISEVYAVPTKDSEKHPKLFDVSQHEVSSGVLESNKHPIPSSKSFYNSIEQLKEQTKLNNANIYPFVCDENKEDFNLKDISLTSLLSASEIPFSSMELNKRSGNINNSLSTPKESSGNKVNVNLMPCSQYIESKSSVPRNDQGINSLHKDKLSQDQNNLHSDCHFNDITGSTSHLSTHLISSKQKTESACEADDHKGASSFGNTDHVLISNPEGNMLSLLKPTITSISDNVHDMTPLGPFEECVRFNAFKSNYSCVDKNKAKDFDTANAVFLTPVNFICREDAISNNSQVKSIEHSNLCHERGQLDSQSSFPKHVQDSCSATPASVLHKQPTNFVDNRVLIKGSLNSSLCGILHSEGNINVVERGQNQEECILSDPQSNSTPSNAHSGCFIPQIPKYSISKQLGPVKPNTEYSSALTINNEEACTPAAQGIKIVNNNENVSLSLAEKKLKSILKKKKGWQNIEENSSLKYASGFIPCGSMAPVNSKDDSCLETTQFPYASVKMCPTEALDRKAYHGRKRKGQEMEKQEEDSTITPAKGGIIGKVNVQNSEGMMLSNKRPFGIRNHPTEDIVVVASRKMISIEDKFSLGVEKLCVPLIAKPKTLEECLRFVFLSQPQLHLLQATVKQIREDINIMKVLSSQHFQALDEKKCLQIEKKPIPTMNQRLGLVKWLQHVVGYEKSKLLLLQEKKHELMKKGRELQFGCQEMDKLKSQSAGPFKKALDRAEKYAYIQSLEVEIAKKLERVSNNRVLMEGKLHSTEGDNKKSCERAIIMKQELEGLGNRIKDMCDYYCGVFKVKSNTDKDEITMLLKHHIEKRSHTTIVREDMQLWKVKEIKSNPRDHFIELSYNDVLYQRFVFEGHGSDLNVSIYNRINNETIEKVFPFMNACEVFQYVIGLNQIQKIGGPSSIWQAVRETSFLLGTLMDVLEEVQVSRMRLQNLSFTQFVWPADQELRLQLTFIDCTLGLKARVVLDMSNLRRAVYPCDVLPLKMDIEQFWRTLLMPEELDEVMVGVKPGYSRIKDLCGRISTLIESKR